MPFIIPFIPAIVGALGATAFWVGVATVASAIASGIYASQQRRKAKNAARDSYNASLQDRTQMVRGTTEGRDIVLGRVRKSGQIAFIATAGTRKEKLVIVLAMAGHEVDGFEQWYFNDLAVTLDGSGFVQTYPYRYGYIRSQSQSQIATVAGSIAITLANVPTAGTISAVLDNSAGAYGFDLPLTSFSVVGSTVTITDAAIQVGSQVRVSYTYDDFQPYARIRTYAGTDTQAADSALQTLFPGVWTSDHRLRGIAYAIIELTYNDDVYTSGIPQFSCVMRGAKVFDPRTSTTAWSENPALLFRYLATSPLAGRQSALNIDDASIIAAANTCDASTNYPVDRGAGLVVETRPQFRGAYTFKSGARPKDGLDDLATAMAGKWCFQGNRLTLKAGAYTSPVMTLTDDDFGSGANVQIQPTKPREQLANIVTATCVDMDNEYRVVDMPRVEAAAFITADGAELPIETEFAAIAYIPQAQFVSRIMLRDARQGLTLIAQFKMRAYPIQVLDTVAITNSRYGWSSKAFEVLSRSWTLEGLLQLVLKETAASIFTLDLAFDAADSAPNTNLPLPWVVPAITGVAVTSDTTLEDGTPVSRARVSWTASTSEAVLQGGRIEVAYIRLSEVTSTVDWPSVFTSGSATSVTIAGLTAGRAYVFRVRADNGLARSPWSSPPITRVIARVPDMMTFRAVSRGGSDTAGPATGGFYNADSGALISASARSYHVIIITRSTRSIDSSTVYDVFAGGAAITSMAAALNAAGPTKIVVVIADNEPQTNRLTASLYQAMLRCGASRAVYGSPQFRFAAAYVLIGIGGCGEGNGFEAYQGETDSSASAWCDIAFQISPTGQLLVTGQGATPRTLADYAYTGDLNATNDLALYQSVGSSHAISGNSVRAPGGGSFIANVASVNGFSLGSFCSFVPSVGAYYIAGLSLSPLSGPTSLAYSFIARSDNLVNVRENGVETAVSAYGAGDELAVTFDGYRVRYYKNGVLIRGPVLASGDPRYFVCSIVDTLNPSLSRIRFGPLSSVTDIATGQVQGQAATEVFSGFVAGPVTASSAGPTTLNTAVIAAFTPPVACQLIVTVICAAFKNGTGKSVARPYINQGSVNAGQGVVASTTNAPLATRTIFNVSAGVACTVGLQLQSSTTAGNDITAEDIYATAELIKL